MRVAERGRNPLFLLSQGMITEAQIRQLAEPAIEGTSLYILQLRIKPGNQIQLLLDGSGPVSIVDCMKVSRAIEHNLDREVEDFALEVTSPGLDQPLVDRRQYIKNTGRQVKVELLDGKELKGTIESVTDNHFVLQFEIKEKPEGAKKKITRVVHETIAFEQIKQTKIIITFNN
jgi:ribosome maturation factor RimP